MSVVVLQNSMDLLNGELGSTSETFGSSNLDGCEVISREAERVTDIKEEEDQEPTTVPVIKAEPIVSCVLEVKVCTFLKGNIHNCMPVY
jgi:hypothetical protein